MTSDRSDQSVSSNKPPTKRGWLKIFFGMSPGVGKTYAMLQAAQAKRREGLDVVAGVVETHGRAETEALLEGLERLPLRQAEYRGARFPEFDLDGMLERAPQIALIDELAHSNVPGGRHPKRYQDVRELLDSGIHVYTTMNVQHLESRADAVEALSSVAVRERVPDTVLEWADEIEIVDLSPEGLRQRLAEGKVYLGDRAATAANAFFSARNLAALREMALRSTAERVNRDLLKTLKQEREAKPLPTGERIMVAIGTSPFSERLIRWTKRYATSLNATWVAVHVEAADAPQGDDRKRLEANLELARSLGAEIVSTSGENIPDSILRSARRELVTQIVVGRSQAGRIRRLVTRSLTDRLIADSGPIAVHVVPSEVEPARVKWSRIRAAESVGPRPYLVALASAVALGAACYPFRAAIGHWNVALLFLTLTVLGGFFLSRGPVLALAIVSAVGWNYFYVPPQFTLQIHSGQDVLLFSILFLVAITMGQLTARLRALNLAERRRETRSYALYRFLDCLNRQSEPERTIDEALNHAAEVTGCRVQLILREGQIGGRNRFPADARTNEKEDGVVAWVSRNREMAGAGTPSLPDVSALYLPVDSGDHAAGALRVDVQGSRLPLAIRDLLMQMSNLLGRFLDRERLREQAERAHVLEASQRLQKTLLDTVSHELKTPLTVILGALEQIARSSREPREADLIGEAERSANRLLRNVNMLLDLTRYEGGVVRPKREAVDLHDVANRLRQELEAEFGARVADVSFEISADFLESDDGLLFQLLNQLLRNALGHTPESTPVRCVVALSSGALLLEVSDSGPGLPDDVDQLFEPFARGPLRRSKGLGLGLSIARRISETLGGGLEASASDTGGARFFARIPINQDTKDGTTTDYRAD